VGLGFVVVSVFIEVVCGDLGGEAVWARKYFEGAGSGRVEQ
jgi:hypothetical protein